MAFSGAVSPFAEGKSVNALFAKLPTYSMDSAASLANDTGRGGETLSCLVNCTT